MLVNADRVLPPAEEPHVPCGTPDYGACQRKRPLTARGDRVPGRHYRGAAATHPEEREAMSPKTVSSWGAASLPCQCGTLPGEVGPGRDSQEAGPVRPGSGRT